MIKYTGIEKRTNHLEICHVAVVGNGNVRRIEEANQIDDLSAELVTDTRIVQVARGVGIEERFGVCAEEPECDLHRGTVR